MIGHKLDVLIHQFGVHPNQRHGQCVCNKLLLNGHRIGDDVVELFFGHFILDMVRVEHTGEIAVQPLIAGDQFVRKGQTWHQAPLFKPVNRAKRTRKENALYGGKRNEPLGKRTVIDPAQRPLSLLSDARNGVDSVE